MMPRATTWALCLPLVAVAVSPASAEQARKIEKTAICADAQCKRGAAAYRPWELKLQVPAALGICTTYRTTPFLAVVLTRDMPDTSEDDCDDLLKGRDAKVIDAMRQKAVPAFRGRPVFARAVHGLWPLRAIRCRGRAEPAAQFRGRPRRERPRRGGAAAQRRESALSQVRDRFDDGLYRYRRRTLQVVSAVTAPRAASAIIAAKPRFE